MCYSLQPNVYTRMKALVLAAVCLLASGAAAQTPEAASGGVHVVGEWALEVRTAEGALVEARRFRNDLTAAGARYLLGVLARESVHGALGLRVLSAAGPCADGSGGRTACILREPGALGEDEAVTEDLEFTVVPATGNEPSRIRYRGSVSADFDDSITEVQSWFARCEYGAVLECDASNAPVVDAFTARTLGAPLSIQAGQTVDVTFEISFD